MFLLPPGHLAVLPGVPPFLPSLEEAARRCGVSERTLENIINRRHVPRGSTRERIVGWISAATKLDDATARKVLKRFADPPELSWRRAVRDFDMGARAAGGAGSFLDATKALVLPMERLDHTCRQFFQEDRLDLLVQEIVKTPLALGMLDDELRSTLVQARGPNSLRAPLFILMLRSALVTLACLAVDFTGYRRTDPWGARVLPRVRGERIVGPVHLWFERVRDVLGIRSRAEMARRVVSLEQFTDKTLSRWEQEVRPNGRKALPPRDQFELFIRDLFGDLVSPPDATLEIHLSFWFAQIVERLMRLLRAAIDAGWFRGGASDIEEFFASYGEWYVLARKAARRRRLRRVLRNGTALRVRRGLPIVPTSA
ncbi:MAG: hypothetical protein ACYDA8_07280 [Deferrisomatales bacterium]